MRTIKISIFSLLCLIALAFANRFSPSFTATGQVTTLSAPTNVTASDNAYATKVEIEWEAIRGATLYRIFRNTANDSASAIVVGMNSFRRRARLRAERVTLRRTADQIRAPSLAA